MPVKFRSPRQANNDPVLQTRAMSELALALLLAALMTGPSPSGARDVHASADAPAATVRGHAAGAATTEGATRQPQRKDKRSSDARPEIVCPAAAPVPAAAD